jgi:hypothetical protein
VDGTAAGFELAHRTAGMVDVDPPGVGGPNHAPRTVKQLRPERLLKLANLLGQRWLRHMQLSRRAGEAAMVGDGEQVAGVAKQHKFDAVSNLSLTL